MKTRILPFLSCLFLLASCSTAYKSGQTPDDVYYSPAHPEVAKDSDKVEEDRYEDYVKSNEERYLRMKTRNRTRWQTLDDYEYWNDTRYIPYTYSYYHNNWNNWYVWNTWNSPFIRLGYSNYCCCMGPVNNIKTGYYIPVRQTPVTRPDLKTYRNTNYNNTNSLGGSLKRIFSDGNNYNNRNSNGSSRSSDRSYTPSSSGGSSSSGSGGGGVSRPGRN